MAAAAAPMDTVKLNDGTSIEMARVNGVDDATWEEVKSYLQSNPEMAKNLQKQSKNPEAIRGWLETQAIATHYQEKLEAGDQSTQDSMKALESDKEFEHVFEDIKKNGMDAVMKYYHDEEMMLKISQKMGGLPQSLQPVLKKLEEASLTVHEACKNGDLKAVQEYLAKKIPIDAQDQKGITPLGYAIGANRIAVVKLLLDSRANIFSVDSQGNSAAHYASGYGRRELLEYLVKVGANVNQANAQNMTPLFVATQNKQTASIDFLKANGAK